MFIDVHTTMLKASQNKNVLSCRFSATAKLLVLLEALHDFLPLLLDYE